MTPGATKVVVLMSTWQGGRYVEAQLRSILDQLPAGGRVIVRDDGSTDDTASRVETLGDARVTLVRGHNVGFVRSFFDLLDRVPEDAEYVMLSDQDDVWLPCKIERTVSHLAPFGDQPALYCSRLQLVDQDLHPIGLSPAWRMAPSFRNALAQNIVTGCTCAINRAALPLARQHGNADLVYFHDWWLYLVIAAFGRVVYDAEPTILYRQHAANAIGMGSGLRRYLTMLRFLGRKNWVHIMYGQIENFRSLHGARLDPDQRRLLDRYFDPHRPSTVARLLFTPDRFCQTLVNELLLRVLLLANVLRGGRLLP